MKLKAKRQIEGKPVCETDFLEGEGWCVELARAANSPELVLLSYRGDADKLEGATALDQGKYALCPPDQDELTLHLRLARCVRKYGSVTELLQKVQAFLARCIELNESHRFLLACFVLSTWVVDQLPVAPYIALVGLPRSGKTTALSALYLLCRRGLMTSDISSAAFRRVCERLIPTLCIDEAATAGQKRSLLHFLRSGTTRNGIASGEWQSYGVYGAKAIAWTEMPDDDALNSRCIVIPMRESSRTDLLRTTDPAIISAADDLQGQLMRYRLEKYRTLTLPAIAGVERLRSRDRDLYEALALPVGEDPKACARLLECLLIQQELKREPLRTSQMAALESLFKHIHIAPAQEACSLKQLKEETNSNLATSGERFHINEKGLSNILRTCGFVDRKRTKNGWVVLIDRAARKRIHELLSLYGVNSPSSWCSHQESTKQCEFCVEVAVTETRSIDLVGANKN